MNPLADVQHEIFAQHRANGASLLEAYRRAGYHNGGRTAALRLQDTPAVTERIAALQAASLDRASYEKARAVQDLITIIHAKPADASADHPLCEVLMSRDGPYHRFPPKLLAMARLIKLMGWQEPQEPDTTSAQALLTANLAEIRMRRQRQTPQPTNPPTPPQIPNNRSTTAQPAPTTAQLPPRQEAFARARFRGLGVMEAYTAAGYSGKTANLAWRLNASPPIRDRLAALNRDLATTLSYHRADAERDLVSILQARPSEASPDHPLCEERLSAWGPYHRFPSKLGTLMLLARLKGWLHLPINTRSSRRKEALTPSSTMSPPPRSPIPALATLYQPT